MFHVRDQSTGVFPSQFVGVSPPYPWEFLHVRSRTSIFKASKNCWRPKSVMIKTETTESAHPNGSNLIHRLIFPLFFVSWVVDFYKFFHGKSPFVQTIWGIFLVKNVTTSKWATLSPSWNPKQPFKKWMFQWDDSKSLYRKWLFHQTSMKKWLFGVPGCYVFFHVATGNLKLSSYRVVCFTGSKGGNFSNQKDYLDHLPRRNVGQLFCFFGSDPKSYIKKTTTTTKRPIKSQAVWVPLKVQIWYCWLFRNPKQPGMYWKPGP